MAVAEEGCKFTKSYPLKSTCTGQYLYLIRDGSNAVKELCVTDLTDPEIQEKLTQLPKEAVIPIQKSYYAMIEVSNVQFSLPEIVYK